MVKVTTKERPMFEKILDTGELILAEFAHCDNYKKISRICTNLYNKGIIDRVEQIGFKNNAPYRLVTYIPHLFTQMYDQRRS